MRGPAYRRPILLLSLPGAEPVLLTAEAIAATGVEHRIARLTVWQKDMDVIAAFAAGLGVATPLFTATRPLYDEALATGLGSHDTAAVHRVVAHRSGAGGEP